MNLGSIYHHGTEGVEKDIQKAIMYYEKAASMGNKLASFNLNDLQNENQNQN